MRYALLLLALLLVGGCNLFSPFHDEGSSESTEDIIADVEAALERGEPEKAYEYAADGIEKHPESVTLHYLAAVARVQTAEIGFADFASMIRSGDGDDEPDFAVLHPTALADGDTTFFLDLSPEDLAEMAGVFNVTYDLLEAAVELIEQGEATPQEVANIGGDLHLGLGISGLLKAMLTVLDTDHDLYDGFDLDESIRAFETEEGGWGFTAIVVPEVVCNALPWLRVAEEALYDHYRSVAEGDIPEDIPAEYRNLRVFDNNDNPLWTNPAIDDDLMTGDIFVSVHDGVVDFHENYTCDN
jgi:hypothetical protein